MSFQFVEQCLNQLHHCVPPKLCLQKWNFLRWEEWQSYKATIFLLGQIVGVTSLSTGMDCETWDSSRNVGPPMSMMELKMMCYLKNANDLTLTIVMMSVTAMTKISEDSVTSRNFILHCYFVEYICEFELKLWIKYFLPNFPSKILVCLNGWGHRIVMEVQSVIRHILRGGRKKNSVTIKLILSSQHPMFIITLIYILH